MRWIVCFVYRDDVIVLSTKIGAVVGHVENIQSIPKESGVSLKLSKLFFFKEKLYYLWYTIIPGKLMAAIYTESAMNRVALHVNKTRLNAFLRNCNVYRKLFKDFAKRTQPLSTMLKMGTEPNWGHPTELHNNTFKELKKSLTKPPII